MSSYAGLLLERYRTKGILVDTNLLLLYVVGRYDAGIVRDVRFSRIAQYTQEDFDLLSSLLSLFAVKVTTAPVLAEVTNWIGKLSRAQEIACLATLKDHLNGFIEVSLDSFELLRQERFRFLGLTDIGLAHVASAYLIVTDDAGLSFHLNEMGLECLNINHVRQERWLAS